MKNINSIFFLSFILLLNIACKSSEPVSPQKPMADNSMAIDTTDIDTTATDATAADSTEEDKTSYEEIVEKADKTAKGLMNIYKVKKKVYLEIPFSLLEREMLLGSTISQISDNDFGALGSKPHAPLHMAFSRVDSTILLRKIERNRIAPDGPKFKAMNAALAKNSMGAIIKKFDVKAYNEDHSAALIEASNFLVSKYEDLSPFNKGGMNLPEGINYSASFKKDRSFVGDFKAFKDNVSIQSHLSYEYDLKSGKRKIRSEQPFTAVMTRTFILLPSEPMLPRIGDSRIGVSTIKKYSFNDPLNKAENIHFARRFRLLPKNIDAYMQGELVEPVEPIVFYVDSDFPESWKQPIKKGIEDWNKTFEEIGFKNAVQALDYPENDSTFDPDNIKYSTIRYAPNMAQRVSGSSWIDPRTGEILNGSIYLYHNLVKRIDHQRFVQTGTADPSARTKELPEAYKKADIRYFVRRQMGFRLGFRPNGAASASIDVDSLRSPSFTQRYGTTYSTLDAARYNYVAQQGDKQRGVRLTSKPFGPYDFYVVKWNYQYFPPKEYTHTEVKERLNAFVDSKAGDIKYRYALPGSIKEPTIQGGDLGNNAVKASTYGIKNLNYILAHLNDWIEGKDKDYSYRQEIWKNIRLQYVQYLNNTVKYVGGIYSNPIYEGDPRPRFKSVPAAKQKQAYTFLIDQISELEWLMQDEVVRNFELTENWPAVLREQMIELVMNGPLMVYTSAKESTESDPYTPEDAMQDLYEAVWQNTIEGNALAEVDVELQKAFVGTAVKNSALPVKGDKEKEEAVNLVSLTNRSFVAEGYQTIPNMRLGVSDYALADEHLMSEGNEVSASYSGGQIHFRVGPPIDLLGYKYLLKAKSLLEEKVEQVADSDTKAHYRLLLHQIGKVI